MRITERMREEILKDIRDGYIDEWDNLTLNELFATIEKEHKEILQYRQGNCTNACTHFDNAVQYGYNKAIEDFYDKVLNFEDYIEPIEENGSILLYSGYAITKMIVMIKEQLKGGSNDR